MTRQTPWSMEFSRQEYWSGLPLPSPGGSSQRGDLSRISWVCSSGRGVLDHCACSVASFSASGSLWPYGLYPARLLCPWDSSGKNSGVGCHFLLQGIFATQDQTLVSYMEALYHQHHLGRPSPGAGLCLKNNKRTGLARKFLLHSESSFFLGRPAWVGILGRVDVHIGIYGVEPNSLFSLI